MLTGCDRIMLPLWSTSVIILVAMEVMVQAIIINFLDYITTVRINFLNFSKFHWIFFKWPEISLLCLILTQNYCSIKDFQSGCLFYIHFISERKTNQNLYENVPNISRVTMVTYKKKHLGAAGRVSKFLWYMYLKNTTF